MLAAVSQQQIIDKKLKFFVIDAYDVAKETGMGSRINTVMQTCFFAISGVLPRDEAIDADQELHREDLRQARRSRRRRRTSQPSIRRSIGCIRLKSPPTVTSTLDLRPAVPAQAPAIVQNVLAPIIAGEGDSLPVSAMPVDGTFPSGTAQWEKRNIALDIPVWDEKLCIQCGKCVLVCPHAIIRAKIYDRSCSKAHRPPSRPVPAALEGLQGPQATRFRSRPKIAPAAASASMSAP